MSENNQDRKKDIYNSHSRVFIVVALLFIALLAMYHLPPITIGDYQLRKVCILSDIADATTTDDSAERQSSILSTQDSTSHNNLPSPGRGRECARTTDSEQGRPLTDYSNGKAGGMSHFYQCLDDIETLGRPVRIAYYGDSFIEGDILTADIRDIMQRKYGGSGVGWADCAKGHNAFRPTVAISSSGLTPYLTGQKPFDSKRQGPNQKYYTPDGEAQLTYKALNFRGRTSTWQQAKLFFTTADSITINVVEDSVTTCHEFAPSPDIQCLLTNGKAKRITYRIKAGKTTSLWGAALEPTKGIVVDNLGLRGISGASLATIPETTLRQLNELRPYDLIIIHYGTNCAVDGNPDSYLKAYTNDMTKVVEKFKNTFPEASILICGISDRDQRTANGIHTAGVVERLTRLQRDMAARCGVAFYDLFKAMGGKDAMTHYVEKGWANKDYTHVNFDGGKQLATVFCNEIEKDRKAPEAPSNSPKGESHIGASNPPSAPTIGSSPSTSHSPLGELEGALGELEEALTYSPSSPLLFSSGMFLVLFFLFTLIYSQLSAKTTARLAFVTLFSYYFYYKSSGMCFLLLAFVTVADYHLARMIYSRRRGRRLLLAASIVTDLGLLFYFKYTNFFGTIVAGMAGCRFTPLDIVLPVGISFFTFQSMSYTIDIYRRRLTPAASLLDYAFYVSFFPQLVAGPIVRARDFIPQIRRLPSISSTMLSRGVLLIASGLIKKAVISDYISLNFVDRVFDSPQLYTGVENLLAIYGYTLQIYCDFSGYSDMAIGIALLLGFHFPDNFNAPFRSASVSEFWRRWHISLSSWIRDYVYIALGGNRRGTLRTYANLLASMVLCGLWHGANLTFVVWGFAHGVLLVAHKLWRSHVVRHASGYVSHGWRRAVGMLLTFHVVSLLFMVFRAPDLSVCAPMLCQVAHDFRLDLAGQVVSAHWQVLSLIVLGYASHFASPRLFSRSVALLCRGGIASLVLLLTAVIYVVVQVKSSEIQPFIYFQF